MITIILDTVRKYRNTKEWRPVNRASALGFERVGDGNNIVNLCGDLVEAGEPITEIVVVKRGDTVCFTPATLGEWALGNFGGKGEQPEHLKRSTT